MGTLHIPPRPAGQARNMSGGSSLPFQNTSARNNCKEKKFLDCFLAQAHISGQLLGLIRVGERNREQSESTRGFSFQPQAEVKALGWHRPIASRESSFDMMLESWIMLNLVLHAGK